MKLKLLSAAAICVLAAASLVAIALARAFTLQTAANATVTDQSRTTSHESIVVNASGRAVYELTGDTTTHHLCTSANGCFKFWPPVTVKSRTVPSKGAGIAGKLGVIKRSGILQVTLG